MNASAGTPSIGAVRLLMRQSFDSVALDTRGAYWKLSGPLARLKDRMVELGVHPTGALVGIFYDDPSQTPPADCRFTLCYPVSAADARIAATALEASAEPGRVSEAHERDIILVRTFPASLVAAIEYRGPSADSPAVYEHLGEWLAASDHRADGPPRELYLAEPGTLGGLMHVEVHQPLVAEG